MLITFLPVELYVANLLINKMLINECDMRVDVCPIDIL